MSLKKILSPIEQFAEMLQERIQKQLRHLSTLLKIPEEEQTKYCAKIGHEPINLKTKCIKIYCASFKKTITEFPIAITTNSF